MPPRRNKQSFVCPRCERAFASKFNLRRHTEATGGVCEHKVKKLKSAQRFACKLCDRTFSRKHAMQRHERIAHTEKSQLYGCGLCDLFFRSKAAVVRHRASRHRDRSSFKFRLVQTAHGGACEKYRLFLPERFTVAFPECLEYCFVKTQHLVSHLLLEKKYMKVSTNLSLRFAQPDFTAEEEEEPLGLEEKEVITVNFRAVARRFMFGDANTNDEKITTMMGELSRRYDEFVNRGSGWRLVDCLFIDVDVGECHSLRGGCSLHELVVQKVGDTLPLMNSTNLCAEEFGQRCFYHAVAAHLMVKARREYDNSILSDQPIFSAYELEQYISQNLRSAQGREAVEVSEITKFEDANAHLDLAVNVVYMAADGKGEIYPVRASPRLSAENQIVLLLFHHEHSSDDQAYEDYGDSAY